jgi:hypothetical protein
MTFKRRFHGGFTSVIRSAWKPLDQWEEIFLFFKATLRLWKLALALEHATT